MRGSVFGGRRLEQPPPASLEPTEVSTASTTEDVHGEGNRVVPARRIGMLKKIRETFGWGFIECAETFQTYQRDVYVPSDVMPAGARVGDELVFTLGWKYEGRPMATFVSFSL